MPAQFLAVNGPHASGKSTILQHLETNGFETRREIASLLIDQHGYDWGRHGNSAFQEEIFDREVDRDNRLLAAKESVAIETWHFGNIAHCMEVASSDLVKRQRTHLSTICEGDDIEIAALYLSIPFEEIANRSPHVDSGDQETQKFYQRIERHIFALYEEYEIERLVVDNSEGNLQETLETALQFAERVINN